MKEPGGLAVEWLNDVLFYVDGKAVWVKKLFYAEDEWRFSLEVVTPADSACQEDETPEAAAVDKTYISW